MRKQSALLVLTLLLMAATAGMAEAKGGRTSAADCKAGSSDPDCPDEPDAPAPGKPPTRLAAIDHAMVLHAPARSIVA